jgi:hypothetical protein
MRPEAFKCGIMVVILLSRIIYNIVNVLCVKVWSEVSFQGCEGRWQDVEHVIGSIATATILDGIFEKTFAPSLKAGKCPSLVPILVWRFIVLEMGGFGLKPRYKSKWT